VSSHPTASSSSWLLLLLILLLPSEGYSPRRTILWNLYEQSLKDLRLTAKEENENDNNEKDINKEDEDIK
jgi:hypothetical protein